MIRKSLGKRNIFGYQSIWVEIETLIELIERFNNFYLINFKNYFLNHLKEKVSFVVIFLFCLCCLLQMISFRVQTFVFFNLKLCRDWAIFAIEESILKEILINSNNSSDTFLACSNLNTLGLIRLSLLELIESMT